MLRLIVQSRDRPTLLRSQELAGERASVGVDLLREGAPVRIVHAGHRLCGPRLCLAPGHAAASRASRVCFAAAPPAY